VKYQHIDPCRLGAGVVVRRRAVDCLQLDHAGRASLLAIWS
jgi:hypothetical protein